MTERFLHVYMDLNNKCNLKCRMCYFWLDLKKEPYKVMDLGLFKKIARQVFPKAARINLSCAAEPFIMDNYPEYLAVVKKYDVPDKTIVTNAYAMNEDMIRAMIDADITHVDVSIDGATAETYESIRGGSDFERVIGNVKMLQEIKRQGGSKIPYVHLDYTLMKRNIGELPDFLKLAKELGADHVRANHLIPFKGLGIMDESLVNFKEETNTILKETRIKATELALDVEVPPDFDLNAPDNKEPVFNKPDCRIPFYSMYIISDGRVTPCVWFPVKKYLAGDFTKEDFDAIWDSAIYREVRECFEAGKFTEYCRNCPVYGADDLGNYAFLEREREDISNISSSPLR